LFLSITNSKLYTIHIINLECKVGSNIQMK
jgi:hypothetical protein